MLRHYLPAISAFIALLIMIFFFSFGKRADDFGKNFTLKTQVTGSGNFCGQTKVNASVTLELTTLTPQKRDNISNCDYLACDNDQDKNFDPPLFVLKSNPGGWGTFLKFFYKTALLSTLNQFDPEKTFSPPAVVDQIQSNTTGSKGMIGFSTIIQYEKKAEPLPFPDLFTNLDDTTNGSKSLREILGAKLSGKLNDSSPDTKVIQTVRLLSSSDRVKIGIGTVDVPTAQLVKESGSIPELQKADFDKPLVACKDALDGNGNPTPDGVCDKNNQCKAAPKTPVCGDSVLDSGEQCDHGASNGKAGDTCTDKCQTVAVCGNGVVEAPEQCDHGAQNGKDAQCTKDCKNTTPTFRTISMKKSPTPTISIQVPLTDLEQLSFQNGCSSCTLSTDQDPTKILGGQSAAQQNFIITATLTAADKSLSQTIVAVGNYKQESHLFTKKGVEYGNIGEDPDTQYLPSFLNGQANDYFFRMPIGSGIENVSTTATPLPSLKDVPFKNGDPSYFLLSGDDSSGVTHLMVVKGRYWDLSAVIDKGDLKKCAATVGSLPSATTFVQSSSGFQNLLDQLTLCQRR